MGTNPNWELFIELLRDVIDNDTLIIVGALVIAGISPEHRELVLGGLIGYMGKKYRDSLGE